MGVDVHSPLHVGQRGVAITEGEADLASVEVEKGVGRTQAQGLIGVDESLCVTPVGVQLPGEGIGHEHALAPVPFRSGGSQALGQTDAVIGAEQRRLEVDVDAIGGENFLLSVEERELLPGLVGLAGGTCLAGSTTSNMWACKKVDLPV